MKANKLLSMSLLLIGAISFYGFTRVSHNLKGDDVTQKIVVTVDGIKSGTITLSQVMKVSEVHAQLPGTQPGMDVSYEVVSFTYGLAPGKTSTESHVMPFIEEMNGNRLGNAARKRLANIHAGDLFIIGNVNVTDPSGKKLLVSGVTYTVVAD